MPPYAEIYQFVQALAPTWRKTRRFTARGQLSYGRLGLEVLRAPDLHGLVQRLVQWLADHRWPHTPLWLPWQRRYRRRQGWLAAA